ncbi:hypothetical protein [Psychrobacter immobilis]|uniref:hypothetical protein n=1 Tax=Psychrobacter immobilis TaxID=498 RepID=UPI003FCF5974
MSKFIAYNHMLINVDSIKMITMTRPLVDGKDGDHHLIDIIMNDAEPIRLAPIYKDNKKAERVFKDIAEILEAKKISTDR